MEDVSISERTCARCGHQWYLRKPQLPRLCPKCKSPFWRVESQYKQELDLEKQKALGIEKKLIDVMEKLIRDPSYWAEVVKVGWERMFETSDFPIKNIGWILGEGFSIYDWFMKVHEVSPKLVAGLVQKLAGLKEQKSSCTTDIDTEKIKQVLGWEEVLVSLNEEGVKVLAFLWFADTLANQVLYPETEAIIRERAWLLLEENIGRKKEMLDIVEQMVDRIDGSSRGATSWAEVIRFP